MPDIKDIERDLEKLMYGYNYEVTFGSDVFENCGDQSEFRRRFKERYPESRPVAIDLISMNEEDVWKSIRLGLDYRGDRGSGLRLDAAAEDKLKSVQASYLEKVQQLMANTSTIFSYPDYEGMPYYPVFWGYSFVIFRKDKSCVFLYGSSSD